MRTKSRYFFLIAMAAVLFGFLFNASVFPAENGNAKTEGFYLTAGNPDEGRKVFSKMQCYACHFVASDSSFPAPVAENPGPTLGVDEAPQTASEIADAIVSPSHEIFGSDEGRGEEGRLSRMGDFSSVMTVQELKDIVAYLLTQNRS